jgi:hypothetical protein
VTTGKAQTARLLLDLCAPLERHVSPGGAQVRIGPESAHFDRKAEWFEGFARPLWGLAPLHAGGGKFDAWARFVRGIEAGTDPAHPEYWEPVRDSDQRSVEMAALGFALALAPDVLWDPLPRTARANLVAWLRGIERVAMADNNWHFFPVMAGLGLERIGAPIETSAHLDRIEAFVRSDGWYGDGAGGYIDHYGPFALHFYSLIYARHRDDARARAYRERAAAFAPQFAQWFADDGAALPIGRSLTYRFAMAGFWGALAYAGVEALPWGVIRGLWGRQVRWWLEKPVRTPEGLLPIGYTTPNMLMSEEYNSQGSPYWACKAFLPLALPDDHPFWIADEVPHPARGAVTLLPGASMLVQRRAGEVTALPGGPVRTDMRNSTDKYGRLAYATATGFAVEGERWIELGFCGDNLLAVSADGETWATRRRIQALRTGEGFIETRWSPLGGVTVTTLQGFADGWELRVHRVETAHALRMVESGYALPCHTASRRALAQACTDGAVRPAGIMLELGDLRQSVICAFDGTRGALIAAVAPNTHLQFPKASVPVLAGATAAGVHVIAAACAAGQSLAPPPAEGFGRLLAAAGWPVQRIASAPPLALVRREADS